MIISINQPYFFPYIGFFQLLYVSDIFVSYDNVDYSKNKWITSNFVLDSNKKLVPIGLSLKKKSQSSKINDLFLSDDVKLKNKLYKTIKHIYSKSVNFNDVYSILEQSLKYDKLSDLNTTSIRLVFEFLEIKKNIIQASTLKDYDSKESRNEKLLNIINHLSGTTYVNLIGGKKLYDKSDFQKENIGLFFLESKSQLKCSFLHLLFTMSKNQIIDELNKFELV